MDEKILALAEKDLDAVVSRRIAESLADLEIDQKVKNDLESRLGRIVSVVVQDPAADKKIRKKISELVDAEFQSK